MIGSVGFMGKTVGGPPSVWHFNGCQMIEGLQNMNAFSFKGQIKININAVRTQSEKSHHKKIYNTGLNPQLNYLLMLLGSSI